MNYAHYAPLAGLFDFPRPGFGARAGALLEFLKAGYPDAAAELAQFLDGIPENLIDLQELHTRTFDIQCVSSLEVGYVLFGDDYKRGALLANLSREHSLAKNECGGELADYLPNVLRLIPRLADEELRRELATELLLPALVRMSREFEPARMQSKNASYRKHYRTLIDPARTADPGIYSRALRTTINVVARDFEVQAATAGLPGPDSLPCTADFLGSIEREMEIESSANPANSGRDT